MNKTFKFLLFFFAVFLLVESPAYAKMTAEQFQQQLMSQLSSSELNAPVVSKSDDSKGDKSPKESSKSTKKQSTTSSKDESAKAPSADLFATSLGDSEQVAPAMPDFTKRGYASAGDNISVSAWNGLATVKVPLIHVPGNDGLSLDVVYAYDDYSAEAVSNYKYVSYQDKGILHGQVVPGLVGGDGIGAKSAFNFRDQDGDVHVFYYTSSGHYKSRDHWLATTSGSNYTIYAPNGITYQGNSTHINKITSTHGKEAITYTWTESNKVVTMALQSSGYKVTWNSNTGELTQTDTHTILLHTSNQAVADGYRRVCADYNSKNGCMRYGKQYYYKEGPGSDTITFSGSYLWTLNFTNAFPQGSPGTQNINANATEYVNYLTQVKNPYGALTKFSVGTTKTTFPEQKDNASFTPRFGSYRVNSYTKSGPGMPSGTWKYGYAKDATTITGPVQTEVVHFVPVGASDTPEVHHVMVPILNGGITFFVPSTYTTYQPKNHYINGLTLNDWIRDTKTGASLSYTSYEYSYRGLGPMQNSGNAANTKEYQLIPYQSEATQVTYATTSGASPLITNTYGYNSDGLVTSENLGAINGLNQAITKGYFDKQYKDENNISHYLISTISDVTKDYSGTPVDSSTSVIDDNGYTTSSTHNATTTRYTYDAEGNLATQTNALGNTTAYSDYYAGFARHVTDALGHVGTYTVNSDGTVASYKDPDGNESDFAYDYLGRVTQVTMPNKDIYTNAYTLVSGEQVTTTHGDAVQTTVYNAFAKPESVTITAPGIDTYTQTHQYDVIGREIFTSYPSDTQGTSTSYDGLGRVVETDWPVSSAGETGTYHTTTAYPRWDKVEHTNANGYETDVTNYIVGSWNNSLGPVETDIPTSAGNQITTITRDAMGRMLSVEQGGYTRSYNYSTDGHYWLLSIDNPETGKTQYTYDDIGEVLSSQVGNSGITHNTYNAVGELTKVEYPDTTVDTFTYTPTGKKESASISGDNTMPNTWTYTFDSLDNLKTAKLKFGTSGPEFDFSYDYDSHGFMTSATYADGTTVDYAPDALGRPTKGGSWVNSVSYMADGHEKSFTDANGVKTTYTLNARHMVSDINVTSLLSLQNGDQNVTVSYKYDGDTNITQVTDSRPNHDRSYSYDGADWLTSGKVDGTDVNISYDLTGNITEKDYGSSTLAYDYDNTTNRLTSVSGPITGALTQGAGDKDLKETFTYDNYGDVTSRDGSGTGFTYNDAKELTQAQGTNPATDATFNLKYYYDAMGNRIAVQDVKNSTLHYEIFNEKGKLLYKTDEQHDTTYIYLNGRKIAESTHVAGTSASVDTSTFFHNDLQGSILFKSDPNGNILNPSTYGQSYLPYGSELNPGIYKDTLTGDIGEHIGFINKPYNSATGLSYFGARYYDPLIGRFMGTDPIGYVGGTTSFNRYAYANNNPLRYVDPDGMSGIDGGQCTPGGNCSPSGNNENRGNGGNSDVDTAGSTKSQESMMDKIEDNLESGMKKIGEFCEDNPQVCVDAGEMGLSAVCPECELGVLGENALATGAKYVGDSLGLHESSTSISDPNQTGSYTNYHESGKKYHGKGPRKRSQISGKREASRNDDPHVATDWTSATNDREAFKQESRRLDADGGHTSPTNYNRIEQPGKKYRQQDGEL